MSPRFVFVVGSPGAGKTTLVRRLIEDGSALNDNPKWTVGKAVAAAGHYTGATFDGADTVPYNGVADALAWWELALWDRAVTIFDGDRFSSSTALVWARARGVVDVVHVGVPQALLDQRRVERGSNQNATWAKGRATKARRFVEQFDDEHRLELNGELPPADLEALVRAWKGWP